MASSGESVPLGRAGRPQPSDAPAPEPPPVRRERGARALTVAAQLLAGATTFFFLAFVFAYFYLRSLNVHHEWKPPHVNPDQGLGVAFIACVLVSAGLAIVAGRRERANADWVVPGVASVVLGLAAVAAQCIGFTQQDFGPTDGGFASVFCTWLAFYAIAVLGTMYWLETHLATELRERRHPTAKPGEGVVVYEHPDRLLPRGLDAAVFYWGYLAAIGVVTYVVLYLL